MTAKVKQAEILDKLYNNRNNNNRINNPNIKIINKLNY
jgi:hypothetical protein